MARDLFRVTVDEYNYSDVLGEPLDGTQRALLPGEVRNEREMRIWAINTDSDTAKTYRRDMNSGDGLLFYKVKRGRAPDEQTYVGVGVIGEKFRTDPDTATRLFRTPTAHLMFTVEEFSPISKTIDDIEELLGYSSYPQRTQRVTENRYRSVDQILTRLQS